MDLITVDLPVVLVLGQARGHDRPCNIDESPRDVDWGSRLLHRRLPLRAESAGRVVRYGPIAQIKEGSPRQ